MPATHVRMLKRKQRSGTLALRLFQEASESGKELLPDIAAGWYVM